jgi:uncharacterized protein YbjQ (UPF0145 family)
MTVEDIIGVLFVLLFFISPVIVFLTTWWISAEMEKNHYRSIHAREQKFDRLPVVPTRSSDSRRRIVESRLVTGSVVISGGPLKRLTARFRMIIGGPIRGYEILLDRARREAILRMKESFPEADMILNLRLETSTIVRSQGREGMAAVEVVASGTAVRYAPVA